jgi:hypothetical protein
MAQYQRNRKRRRRSLRQALYRTAQLPFFVAIARALDIAGALNEPAEHERFSAGDAADAAGLGSDWAAVLRDVDEATARLKVEINPPETLDLFASAEDESAEVGQTS